jgi:ribonuclease P protein component
MMPGSTPRNTFPRSEKLKSRNALEALYGQGVPYSAYPIRMLTLKVPFDAAHPVKIAVSAPKRKLKAAPDRNRMKRLMREAWRLHKHDFIQHCRTREVSYHLLLISQCNTPVPYALVKEKITLLLKRLTEDDQKSPE